MKPKIILLTIAIISIIILALFSFGLKEKAVKGIVEEVSEYNCGENGFCTSCIIDGNSCSCGQHTCECGDNIVDKEECSLF